MDVLFSLGCNTELTIIEYGILNPYSLITGAFTYRAMLHPPREIILLKDDIACRNLNGLLNFKEGKTQKRPNFMYSFSNA